MSNPFKNTEPDFSKSDEFRLSPDREPYLGRIASARLKGDHKTELLEAQKLLFLYRSQGSDVFIGALRRVASAWESLERSDIAAAYIEEALNQIRDLERYQDSKIALENEFERLSAKTTIAEKPSF